MIKYLIVCFSVAYTYAADFPPPPDPVPAQDLVNSNVVAAPPGIRPVADYPASHPGISVHLINSDDPGNFKVDTDRAQPPEMRTNMSPTGGFAVQDSAVPKEDPYLRISVVDDLMSTNRIAEIRIYDQDSVFFITEQVVE